MMNMTTFRAGLHWYGFIAAIHVFWIMLLIWAVGVSAATIPRFAYGTNAGDWSLTRYLVDPDTGKLSHDGHVPQDVYPVAVSVDPTGHFLLSLSMTDDTVSVQTIDPENGALNPVDGSSFPSGVRSPYSISWHPSGQFVYVSARFTGVAAYAFNAQTGALTPVPGSPYSAQRRTRSVVVHPSGQYVYASNAYDNSISAWRVDGKTGALSPLHGSPYKTGEVGNLDADMLKLIDAPPEAGGIPYMLAVHPSGRYLYVTNWVGPSVSMFSIDLNSGNLTPLAGSPMLTGNNPYAIAIHPSGQFVYVTSWGAQAVFGYAVNAKTGTLNELPGSPYYTGAKNPIALRFNRAGNLAYCVNPGNNTISVFVVDTYNGNFTLRQTMRTRFEPSDIALAEMVSVKVRATNAYVVEGKKLRVMHVNPDNGNLLPGKEFDSGFKLHSIAVEPGGRIIYLAGEKDGKGRLDIIQRTPEGGLKSILKNPYELGIVPADMVLDTSGHFLYLIDPYNEGLFVFAVNADSGTLGTMRDRPPRTGRNPVALAIDPAARFSFVANADDNSVSVFTHRRFGTAAIYPIDQPPFKYAVGKKPTALAVDPTGKYLFVANAGDNTLSVFKIHYHLGSLEAFSKAPFPTGKSPAAILIHPDGERVLVANEDSGTISMYHLDSLNAVLKAEASIKVGAHPVAMTFDPAGRFVYVRFKGRENLRKFRLEKANGKLIFAGEVNIGSVTDLLFSLVM